MAKEFPLNVVIRAVDKITGPLRKIQGQVSGLGEKLKSLSGRSGIPAVIEATKGVGSAFGQVGASLWNAGKALAAFGASAGITGAAVFQLMRGYSDAAGSLNDLEQATGISARKLQEWGYGAQQTSVDAGAFASAMKKLSSNIGQALVGKGSAVAVLQGFGVALRDAGGRAKKVDELLPQIADKLIRIKSPALQAAAAQKIFGKSGVDLLPLLKGGSKGLEEFAKRAQELGIVMGDDAIAAGDEFGDLMDDLNQSFAGVRNTIAGALAPALNELMRQLIDLVVKYRPQIKKFFEDFAPKLPGKLKELAGLVRDLGNALAPVVRFMGWLADTFGGANVILATMATVLGAILIPPLLAATQAVYALGFALATTPIGWIIAGVAALAGAVYLIYKNWDGIAEWFSDTFTKIKSAIKDGLLGAFNFWKKWNLVSVMMRAFDSLVDYLTRLNIAKIVGDKIAGILDVLPNWAKNALNITPSAPAAGAAAVGQTAAGGNRSTAHVTVDFNNLPKGASVSTKASGATFDVNQGYQMAVP